MCLNGAIPLRRPRIELLTILSGVYDGDTIETLVMSEANRSMVMQVCASMMIFLHSDA